MKNILRLIVGLMVAIIIQGCLVVDQSYKSQHQTTNRETLFNKDSLNLSCELARGDKRFLTVLLQFSNNITPLQIKNISITSSSEALKHKAVSMSCWQQKIIYNKSSFNDLPENARWTSIKGFGVQYGFDFTSSHNINSKSLRISVLVEFKNGKSTEIEDEFYRTKHYYFAIH